MTTDSTICECGHHAAYHGKYVGYCHHIDCPCQSFRQKPATSQEVKPCWQLKHPSQPSHDPFWPEPPRGTFRGTLEVDFIAELDGAPIFDGLNAEESKRLYNALTNREKCNAKEQRERAIKQAERGNV